MKSKEENSAKLKGEFSGYLMNIGLTTCKHGKCKLESPWNGLKVIISKL